MLRGWFCTGLGKTATRWGVGGSLAGEHGVGGLIRWRAGVGPQIASQPVDPHHLTRICAAQSAESVTRVRYTGPMTTTPRCQHESCGEPMPITARRHARYCSGRCRTAACRARQSIPTELTSRPRWVRHTARKVPLTIGGAVASSTDPSTWSRYRDAEASSAGAGIGFVLDGDGVVCLDLDGALDEDGSALPWAQQIVDAAGSTWVEVSRSGRGLHVWGRGSLPHGRRIAVGPGSVELYGIGRYIAVTGRTFGDTPRRLGELQHVIDALL